MALFRTNSVSLVFLALFLLFLGGCTALVAVYNVAEQRRTAKWVPVPAEVLHASLEQPRRGPKYAVAQYRYVYEGREYIGEQLGLLVRGHFDQGDWQDEMAHYLSDAKKNRRTVPVYVNPRDPEEAVVDRELRLGVLSMLVAVTIAAPLAAYLVMRHFLLSQK